MDESQYFKDIGRHGLIPPDQEYDLIAKAQSGDESARNLMIEGNLRLVINIAKRYRKLGLPFSDLIAAGNLALFRAIDKFDPSYKCKFSTYATPWVKQGIQRALETEAPRIHIPSYMQELRRKVSRLRLASVADGRELTNYEVLISLGYTHNRARLLDVGLKAAESVSSVGQSDYTADQGPSSESDPYGPMIGEEGKEALWEEINNLPDRDRDILSMRFGIDTGEGMTLAEISDSLDPPLTRERVRQIIRKTASDIRSALIKRGFITED